MGTILTFLINYSMFLYGLSGGFLIAAVIFFYFLLHPEKFQKWAGMIGWAISHIWNRAEYFAIKTEIQGRINSFARTMEANTNIQFPRISVRLIARGKEELFWEEGEVILVVRDRKHKTKNFVHAAYFFTSEALLRKSKRHLSKNQKTSLDLFATKKLLESEDRASVEQFMDEYVVPYIEREDEIRSLFQQYVPIDKKGVFFPILIQELSYLGNKVFLSQPSSEVIDEVKALVNFLEKFSQREVGDIKTPDSFIGKYTRCGIKIIASRQSREKGDITAHKERLANAIKIGLENVYIIGSPQNENMEFMKAVVDAMLAEYPQVQKVRECNFRGLIKIQGTSMRVDTCLIHLHNPNAVKYLYEQNDIEARL